MLMLHRRTARLLRARMPSGDGAIERTAHRQEGSRMMTKSALRACAAGLAAAIALPWSAQAQSDAQRAQAARRTVATHPHCASRTLGPFYWEVGNATGRLAFGSVSPRGDPTTVTADTVLSWASATKWLYAAYVVERFGDDAAARPYLNLASGYSNFRTSDCPAEATVATCPAGERSLNEAMNHVFHYDGGHMQQHANTIGLGPLNNAGLSAEIGAVVGADVGLVYLQPGVAGGGTGTARGYSAFLRRLLAASTAPLRIGSMLGSNPVCTQPGASCNASRLTAVPEAWHYSLGHWIEDDPATTPALNIAYSSPGSFGFYPWVDSGRNYYGVLARQADVFTGKDEGYASVQCGRLVRQAWLTGVPQ
jgi:hypothetical protein